MSSKLKLTYIFFAVCAILLSAGCSYYNTFYNTKKVFAEAEKETKSRTEGSGATRPAARPGTGKPASSARPSTPDALIAPEKYRKVIETGSKLIEYYPTSPWVDDALLLMGISYYRLRDFNRADRKFDELLTLFPNSKKVSDAKLWKARTLIELHKKQDAILLLETSASSNINNAKKAEAEFLLGKMLVDTLQWNGASDHLKKAADLSGDYGTRMEATFYYGRCRYELADYDIAAQSFDRVSRYTKDLQLSYDALIYLAKCRAGQGEIQDGEAILKGMQSNPLYTTLASDLDLELADLTVKAGKTGEGIEIYKEYIKDHPNGEGKGLAFFKLAQINRDIQNDLALAKSYLDSSVSAGASKDIADSARGESMQLSRGLLAINYIHSLQDSLKLLEHENHLADSGAIVVTSADQARLPDSLLTDTVAASGIAVEENDSLQADTLTEVSLMPESLQQDTVAQTNPKSVSKLREQSKEKAETSKSEKNNKLEKIHKLRYELQKTYLQVGEFYAFSLMRKDSAHSYYQKAASMRNNAMAYWKANLYLANVENHDSVLSEQAKAYYHAVVDADSVPVESANLARSKLDMPLIALKSSPQREALQNAENAYWKNNIPPAEALELYSQVVQFDSSTNEAKTALFAKADIYYKHFKNVDSVASVYSQLIALFPDSSFAGSLRKKVAPPDSNSIFNKSDEELFPKKQDIGSLIEQTADSSGWPPPEESLRGRR